MAPELTSRSSSSLSSGSSMLMSSCSELSIVSAPAHGSSPGPLHTMQAAAVEHRGPAGRVRTPCAAALAACWLAPRPGVRRPAAPPAAPLHLPAASTSCARKILLVRGSDGQPRNQTKHIRTLCFDFRKGYECSSVCAGSRQGAKHSRTVQGPAALAPPDD